MLKVVTLVILLSRMPNGITIHRACTPNSQFLVNGRLCFCDGRGSYNEAHCKSISRRQSCQPGQIIWNGCNQCICQENGYLLCSNSHCPEDAVKTPPLRQGLSIFGLSCTPFRTYYVNCSICVCPASGIAIEAQCVTDISCNSPNYGINIASTSKPYCIPNIMYLSSCMQCLCSDRGSDPKNCADACGSVTTKSPARCIPGKLFRIGCNLCRCPDNSIPDPKFCISGSCDQQFKLPSLPVLRSKNKECTPHSFTTPRCMYCDCNSAGVVNEKVCLEIDCAKTNELGKLYTAKACNPGEMVPICIQCFCSRDGEIVAKYCSRVCSHQSKLTILEQILKDNDSNINIIERNKIGRITDNSGCTPNALYIDKGQYCLCPENGDPKFKFCISITEEPKPQENEEFLSNKLEIDYITPCEPNTFVQFDCNTCYCNKNGTIDPKWCTYDDCEAKQLILESHKSHIPEVDKLSGTCHPGSISKLDCNFCICPESGVLREKACTQNDCTEIDNSMYDEKLTCEPLAYYEVDCNICYCPRDGIKNVAKCTKNQCEKNILRSDSCIPGQLFCDECNVCVCPPDGNKMGKACTNHNCYKAPSLLKLSHSLTANHIPINRTKSLDQCFPGEEFVEGCKLCICTDLGLKMYATCESILCEDDTRSLNNVTGSLTTDLVNKTQHPKRVPIRPKRASDDCFSYNVSHSAEREECTPGTMYIIRCKQCICPYFGNINNFCRPLPKNMFCETAFPYFNYLPMGRRKIEVNSTGLNNTKKEKTKLKTPNRSNIEVKVKHEHTKYNCENPGTIVDRCFICDCEEDLVVIEEHCFRSDALNCTDAKPSFLIGNKVDL